MRSTDCCRYLREAEGIVLPSVCVCVCVHVFSMHNNVKTTEAIFIKLGVLIHINKSEAEFDFGDITLNIL